MTSSWTKKEWEQFMHECQKDTSEWLGVTITKCTECPYCSDCYELGWANVEKHRQPNGRFGKLYKE